MATAGDSSPATNGIVLEDGSRSPDSSTKRYVSERLLGRLAHRVYPQHLYVFATQLLDIRDAKFFQIIDGTQNNPWQRCHNVRYDLFTNKFYESKVGSKYRSSVSIIYIQVSKI